MRYLRRYRILGTLYRGRLTSHPSYLTAALKIIMHTNYTYTKDHPQRLHLAILPAVAPAAAALAPVVDTGLVYGDLAVGMRVEVWWLGDWWAGRIRYKSDRNQTITVKFTGDDINTSGILPKMVRIIDDSD